MLAVICAFCILEANCHAAILSATPPEKGEQIAYDHLKKSASDFLGMPLGELSLSPPHEYYLIGADVIANGRLLSEARLFSWQYFVLREEKAVAEIHLNADKTKGPLLNVLRISQGPLIGLMFRASKEAENLQQVQANDYELRFLSAPPMLFSAVWLHRKSDDFLVPLDHPAGHVPKGLMVNKAYSEAEVIEALKPIAAEIIKAARSAPPHAVQ